MKWKNYKQKYRKYKNKINNNKPPSIKKTKKNIKIFNKTVTKDQEK